MKKAVPFSPAEVDQFVQRLRGTYNEVYPDKWRIDWAAIPSPFRWYADLPRIDLPQLPRELAVGDADVGAKWARRPLMDRLGALLQASYGVTGVRWYPEGIAKSSPEEPWPVHREAHFQLRRPVPSAGVTYPTECYVTVSGDESLPGGTYHYDAVRHALVPLPLPGPGRPRSGIRLIFTTPLWKGYFKYSDFSYVLGALDAGAVLGQFELTMRRWGWERHLRFGLDEQAILASLGLDDVDEAAVAVMDERPEERDPAPPPGTRRPPVRPVWHGAAEKRPPVTCAAVRMHAACRRARLPVRLPKVTVPETDAGDRVALPPSSPGSAPVTAAWRRTALGEQFRSTALSIEQVTRWLAQAQAPLPSDLTNTGQALTDIRCVLLARSVRGLDRGAYLPLDDCETLRRLSGDDCGRLALSSMFGHYMNLAQAPLIVVLAGAAKPHKYGDALAYRAQQHLAGIVTQRLLVAAAAEDVTGHPVRGFTSAVLDEPLGLDRLGLASLLLIPLGHYRRALYIESNLNPIAFGAGTDGDI